jgi:hypothetical protein
MARRDEGRLGVAAQGMIQRIRECARLALASHQLRQRRAQRLLEAWAVTLR